MFRYTSISIVFVVLLLSSILQVQYQDSPWWMILVPIFLFFTILIFGSFKIGLNFFFKSLCSIKTSEKKIAITFDDGPNPELTPKLISLLEKENVPAAFFCVGQQVEKHPELIKEIVLKDHLIGNHSYSHHRWFPFFSTKKMIEEIKKTNEAINTIIGKKTGIFRPPYGVTNPNLKHAIEETGMTSIGWSLRSFDTIKTPEKVLNKLKRKTKPGDVVLLHDNDEKIISIMTDYIVWLKENSFKVVSLAQLFEEDTHDK